MKPGQPIYPQAPDAKETKADAPAGNAKTPAMPDWEAPIAPEWEPEDKALPEAQIVAPEIIPTAVMPTPVARPAHPQPAELDTPRDLKALQFNAIAYLDTIIALYKNNPSTPGQQSEIRQLQGDISAQQNAYSSKTSMMKGPASEIISDIVNAKVKEIDQAGEALLQASSHYKHYDRKINTLKQQKGIKGWWNRFRHLKSLTKKRQAATAHPSFKQAYAQLNNLKTEAKSEIQAIVLSATQQQPQVDIPPPNTPPPNSVQAAEPPSPTTTPEIEAARTKFETHHKTFTKNRPDAYRVIKFGDKEIAMPNPVYEQIMGKLMRAEQDFQNAVNDSGLSDNAQQNALANAPDISDHVNAIQKRHQESKRPNWTQDPPAADNPNHGRFGPSPSAGGG